MKSHFLRIITLLTVFLPQLLPAQTFVGSYTSEGDPVYYEITNVAQKKCRTLPGTSTEPGHSDLRGILEIPTTVSFNDVDYTVTEIANYSFKECVGLETVIFNDHIVTIGVGSFIGCTGLTCSLNFPATLHQIFGYAFSGCKNLTGSLNFPANLIGLGPNSFQNCSSLTGGLSFPDQITEIPIYAFDGCSSLDGELVIHKNITSIDSYAFRGCQNIKGDISFLKNLTTIGSSAFRYCNSLTGGIEFPEGITDIPGNVFQDCSGLTGGLVLPPDITSIGEYAFSGCSNLSGTLELPSTIQTIGIAAFQRCTNLELSAKLPESLSTIKDYTFQRCSSMAGILKLPAGLSSIGQQAFQGCTGLMGDLIIPNSVTHIGKNAFQNCIGFDGNLVLSEELSIINDYTFDGCGNFSGQLILPPDLTTLGVSVFNNCSGFTGSLTFPETLISIGTSAFQNCTGLSGGIKFPQAITTISANLFYGCSGLNGEIEFSDVLESIGNEAFHGCSNIIGDLKFPATLKSIGNSAFQECSALNGVLDFPEGLTYLGTSAFSDCSNIKGEIKIPSQIQVINNRVFNNCSGLTGNLIIPDGITSIGIGTFSGCSGLGTECILPSTILSISVAAFQSCRGITKYILPVSVVPDTYSTAFTLLTPKAKLYVPAEAVDDYKAAPGWRNLEIEAIVECESISLSKHRLYMNLGASEQLTATIEPEDITDPRIFWESSDPAVATVDAQGRVTLLTDGVAEITTRCGSQVAVCQVAKYVPVSALKLSEETASVIEGRELALVATVEPENATYPQVTWESSDPAVATVDAYGTVTGVSVGETTVTARAENIEAVCKLSVLPIPAETVELDATAIVIHIGSTTQLSATVGPDNAADKTITWASDNEAVATVDANGLAMAMSVGKANVTATSHNGIAATCEVTVIPVVATGLQMSDESMTLTPDASKKLTVTIQPENTTDRNVTWESSNPAVAEVDSEGNVTALSVGTATITATSHNGLTATCDVTVEPVEATAIELSHTVLTMDYADKVTLTATVLPENTTDKTVTWESSNTAVAEVDSEGNVTAVAAGTATITATCGNATATCEVTVNPVEAREVNLRDTELALYCGDAHQLTITVLPEYTTDKTVTWESSNPSVATVSTGGLVSAADRGQAIVTATCGSVGATCIVTVSYRRVIINEIEYELNPATDPATASVCGGKPNGNGELNIPSLIQWNDVEYNVISIAPQAFADDAITSVVLPETMQTVGNQAFAQCPNIATVTALSTTAPTMDDDGFAADVYNNAQLKVVGSAVTDYQNAPGWRSFAIIKDKDGGLTGIADAATTEAVTIHDGKITAHTTIKVLTLNGLTIATLSEGTTIDTLPAGYYIIVAPGCAIKVRL